MTDWIKGRELLEPPYNLTRRDIFNAVKEGILVPWESPDGDQTNRVWRVFPNDDLHDEFMNLSLLQDKLERAQKWSIKSDEDCIEAHKHDLDLEWVGECPLADLETFINHVLPEMRRRESQALQELPPQIRRLEEELAPNRVWKNLDIGPAQQEALMEKLLDAWYPKDQVSMWISKDIFDTEENIRIIWGPIRSLLGKEFSFGEIKDIAGLAGLDLTKISTLQQTPSGGATKSQLMTGIDSALKVLSETDYNRFLTISTEEIVRRNPILAETLDGYLSRLGWSVHNGSLVPIKLLDLSELPELPTQAHHDLVKAGIRLRDGDLSGAIGAACGAVDTLTSQIYLEESLGDPGAASFQEKVKNAFAARKVIQSLEQQLHDLGWNQGDIKHFKQNLNKSINQAAYLMQELRSKMGDVHGTKPILKPLVYNSLKWAGIIISLLKK